MGRGRTRGGLQGARGKGQGAGWEGDGWEVQVEGSVKI